VSPCKIKKKITYFNIQGHRVNISIKKWRNLSIEKKNGTKSRPKPSRENIKSYYS
jgi:hypothetical protein